MTIQAPAPTKRGQGPTSTRTRSARAAVAAPELPTLPTTGAPDRRAPARTRSAAAQRAYARRAQRSGQRVEQRREVDPAAGRASFVVLIITLLTVGVIATLWLSTQAIADSYRLEEAKRGATELSERAAQLQREVMSGESAPALAERAKELGMVPAGDTARIVVQPDGSVVVVGEPTPAQQPTPPAGQQPPAGQTEDQQDQQQNTQGVGAQGAG